MNYYDIKPLARKVPVYFLSKGRGFQVSYQAPNKITFRPFRKNKGGYSVHTSIVYLSENCSSWKEAQQRAASNFLTVFDLVAAEAVKLFPKENVLFVIRGGWQVSVPPTLKHGMYAFGLFMGVIPTIEIPFIAKKNPSHFLDLTELNKVFS